MKTRIPSFLLERQRPAQEEGRSGRVRRSFVSKGMEHIASVLRSSVIHWETASKRGFFQGIDARVKVLFLISFIVIVSVKKTIASEVAIGLFVLGLALVSRLNLVTHYSRILILTFIFGVLLTLPSAFNILTPGEIVLPILHVEKSRTLWFLTVPQEIGITDEGLRRVVMLSLRVVNSLSVSLLVFATTPFMEFIRALKIFRVPDIFLLTVTLAYRYIFIFASTVYDMHLARKSRLVGPERDTETRRWVAGRIACMYQKSRQRCEEVFKVMVARGFSDSVKLRSQPPLTARDWFVGLGLLVSALLFYRI